MKTAGMAAERPQEKGRAGGHVVLAAVFAALAGVTLLSLALAAAARLPWVELRLHLDARAWPVADAAIRSVSLSERGMAGTGQARELVLVVTYDYEVDGVPHYGHMASFRDVAAPHDRRLRTLYSRLHFALVTGRPMPVFHDPRSPGRAVFERGFEPGTMVRDGLLAAFGGMLGLWLLLLPLRAGRGRAGYSGR